MFSLIVLFVCAYAALSVVVWLMGLVFKIVGWSLRMVLSIALLPVWILVAVIGGLGAALHLLFPVAIVLILIGMFVPEG